MGDSLSAEDRACIIDCGSYTIKYGLNDKLFPSHEHLSVIHNDKRVAIQSKIINWEHIEKLYQYVLHNELLIDPKYLNILISQNTDFMNAKNYICKHLNIMFESLNVRGFNCIDNDILNLYSKGLINGVSFSSGYEITSIKSIHEGQIISNSIQRINFGGKDITFYLKQLLNDKYPHRRIDIDTVQDIKEKLSYIPLNYELECKESDNSIYKLPDGRNIRISQELFKCTEIMFVQQKIQKLVHGAIVNTACSTDNNSKHPTVIMLSGGNTLIDGFKERLHFELKSKTCKNIEIYSEKTRKYNTWIGGSIISSLSSFKTEWITKSEYEEYGKSIINRKCVNTIYGINHSDIAPIQFDVSCSVDSWSNECLNLSDVNNSNNDIQYLQNIKEKTDS